MTPEIVLNQFDTGTLSSLESAGQNRFRSEIVKVREEIAWRVRFSLDSEAENLRL